MTPSPAQAPGSPNFPMGFREFVALIACLMAVNALAIDIMLPALPEIGRDLGLTNANQRQYVVFAYTAGFGVAQLIYGPISDRVGRKPVVLAALFAYIVTAVAAGFANSFDTILVARALQGVAAAATRVLAVSIVRDRFQGRQMARVMSLSFIVFLAVPILAPTLGKAILLVAPWHWIFFALAIFAALIAAFAWVRLPETLHPEFRLPLSPARIGRAAWQVVTIRCSIGYTLCSTLLFGALMGFIGSSEQIFSAGFGAGDTFPLIFAGIAGSMAVASFVNSRIVERVGTRKVSHWALLTYIAIAAVHLLVILSGRETIGTFAVLQAVTMASFALAVSNFNSMAMEPHGQIAGTASSVQGFLSTSLGVVVGVVIGQSFDASQPTLALGVGHFVLGLSTLAIVLWTERGRLFRPTSPAPSAQAVKG